MHGADVIDVFLQPGDYFIGDAGFRVRTLLGSCVSITLWHPRRRIGAMSHFLLPARLCAGVPDARYGDDALDMMVAALAAYDIRPGKCIAKIFGGGDMFPGRGGERETIGQKNGDAACALLAARAIPVVSQCLFGAGHRQIIFDIGSGDVWSRLVEKAAI